MLRRCPVFWTALLPAVLWGLPGLAAAASLHGEVRILPEDEPGAGLWVRVERLGSAIQGSFPGRGSSSMDPMTVYTDAKGHFVVEKLSPGMYSIAIAQDRLPQRLSALGRPRRAVLVSKEDRATVRLEVTTLARLEGTVTREDGVPVRGSRILLFRSGETMPFQQLETDDLGRFSAEDLTPGKPLLLEVRAPEGTYRRIETTPLHAGPHAVAAELPVWTASLRQSVVLDVAVPRVAETALALEWRSTPPEAEQGFAVEILFGGTGRVELKSPPGVYTVRVCELSKSKRVWESERMFRVEESTTPQTFSVTVREVTSDTAALPSR
jgi:hypothetical protein